MIVVHLGIVMLDFAFGLFLCGYEDDGRFQ